MVLNGVPADRNVPLRWYALASVPATYVRLERDEDTFTGFEEERSYHIAALRRVTHPSLASIVNRAVLAAEVAQRGEPHTAGLEAELYGAALMLPAQHRDLIINRKPRALIPFAGVAGRTLAPLQLLGDVPCVRLYSMNMVGWFASTIYNKVMPPEKAREAVLTPEVMDPGNVAARYLDVLAEKANREFPAQDEPLVLISNAAITERGYREGSLEVCKQLVRLLDTFPTRCLKPADLPALPEGHADWAIALLLRASLAGLHNEQL
ncbi:MAG TPA: hypothetical protein VD971_01790 [Phycisphaerales bacterium]|nr:hypothetical protein [Phycisphaerales bacterium]